MSARLSIASHFPGRLRVRAAPFRDVEHVRGVVEQLAAEPGVSGAVATARTGSIVVTYDAHRLQLPWLVQLIVKLGGLDGLEADHDGAPPRPHGPVIRETLDRWNNALFAGTRGQIDAKSAMPGLLASLGVLKLVFGNRRLPEWYDLMFWSFTMFTNLNPPVVEAVPAHEPDGESVH